MQNDDFLLSLLDVLASDNATVQRLIDVAQPLFVNPINVSDSSLEVLGFSRDDSVHNAYWDKLNSPDAFVHYELEEMTNRMGVYALDDKPRLLSIPECGCRTLSCAATWKGRTLAYVLMLEYHREFAEEDIARFSKFCKAVAAAIILSANYEGILESGSEHVLMKLIQSQHVPSAAIEKYLLGKRKTEGEDMRCFVLVAEPVTSVPSHGAIAQHMLNTLRYELPSSKCVIFQNRIVLFVRTRCHISDLKTEVESVMARRGMRCGVSNPLENILDLRRFYDQALCALELADKRVLNSHRAIFYRDVSLYHAFEIIGDNYSLTQLCEPALDGLIKYDSEHGTSWFRTLAVYVLCGQNMKRVAHELNIHRNTLQYRMDKVSSLLDDDLDDIDFLHRVYVSLRVYHYLSPDEFCKQYGIPGHLLQV